MYYKYYVNFISCRHRTEQTQDGPAWLGGGSNPAPGGSGDGSPPAQSGGAAATQHQGGRQQPSTRGIGGRQPSSTARAPSKTRLHSLSTHLFNLLHSHFSSVRGTVINWKICQAPASL